MTTIAVAIQVYALTRSNFAVGLLGLVVFGPMVVGGLYGGAIADVMDRKLLAIAASSGLAATSLILAIQAYADWHSLWVIYAMVALQGLFFAVNNPTRNAMIPRLLPAMHMTAAGLFLRLVPEVPDPLIWAFKTCKPAGQRDVISVGSVLGASWRIRPV